MFKNTAGSPFADLIEPEDLAMLQRVFESCSQQVSTTAEADQLAAEMVRIYLGGLRHETAMLGHLQRK